MADTDATCRKDQVPPEFARAQSILDQHFARMIIQKQFTKVLTEDVWMKSGKITLYDGNFTSASIPSGKGWKWNQAKRRQKIVDQEHNSTVIIIKLVPRVVASRSKKAKKPNIERPSMKLWQFLVSIPSFMGNPVTLLWCEKGMNGPEEQLDTSTLKKKNESEEEVELNIEDYKFLAPFMSPDVAKELWPNADIASVT